MLMVSVPVPFLVSEGLVKASRLVIVPEPVVTLERVTVPARSSMESMMVFGWMFSPVTLMPGVSPEVSIAVSVAEPSAVAVVGSTNLSAMRRGRIVVPVSRT